MKRLLYTLLFLSLFHVAAHGQAPTRLGVPTPQNGIATVGDPAIDANLAPLPTSPAGASYVNISTSTDTVVKASPGTLIGMTVNTGGTTSSVVFYDNTTCTGTKIATVATTGQTSLSFGGIRAATGICAKTAGGAPADITVVYR